MRVVLETLVLAGNVGREIIANKVRSDDADHGNDGAMDLDNQPESVSEIKIKAVMEQTSCTRDHAFNALLSLDWDIEAAKSFLEENKEDDDGTVSDTSSCPPVTKPLPSGRQWGECQSDLSSVHFGVSSQHGDSADPSQNNIGEQVVVTVMKGIPWASSSAHDLGIRTESDGITFLYVDDDSWAENHTDLPRYNHLRYRFLKINSRSVQNCVELDEALSSLSPGDIVTFTLAKTLFSQGEGIGELFLACVSGDAKIAKRIIESNQEIDINKALTGSYADLQKYGEDVVEGYTPLMVAGENGNVAVVKELLSHSEIKVNIADRDGNLFYKNMDETIHKKVPHRVFQHVKCNCKTVLYKVSEKGFSDVVRLLLAHPEIDVNKKDEKHLAPLIVACYEGHVDVVRQLTERSDIEMNEMYYEDTPLSAACKLSNSKIVGILLARGAEFSSMWTFADSNWKTGAIGWRDYEPEILHMLEEHAKQRPTCIVS